MKPDFAAADFFQRHQQQHKHQNNTGDLCRAAGIGGLEPDRENAGGQGLHGKEIHRAKIVQGFHHHNGTARHNRRTRQRQADPQKAAPWPATQSAGYLQCCAGLFTECRAGQKIHIGIERRRNHQNRRAKGTDLGKPVIARRRPAEYRPQGSLKRAGIFPEIHQRIGPDIGGQGQGQQQPPFHNAPSGKAVHHHHPGGQRADGCGNHPHQRHHQQAIGQITRQGGGNQMWPDIFGRKGGKPDNRGNRRDDQQRNHNGQHRPAADQPVFAGNTLVVCHINH